jgi:hypothetical protein
MSYDPTKITVKEIKEALPRLSRQQIIELDQRIHDYLETTLLTRASETSFSEWEDLQENIYDADVCRFATTLCSEEDFLSPLSKLI